MLIKDLIEDIYRAGPQPEIEFWLIDKDGNTKKLDLYITATGKYIYEHHDKENNITPKLILGLQDAQT